MNYSKSVPALGSKRGGDMFRPPNKESSPPKFGAKTAYNLPAISYEPNSPANNNYQMTGPTNYQMTASIQPTDKVKIAGRIEVSREQLIKEMSTLYQQIEEQKKENGRLRFDQGREKGDTAVVNKLKAELHRVRTQVSVYEDLLQTEMFQVSQGKRECEIMRQAMQNAVQGADDAAEEVVRLTLQNEALQIQLDEVKERGKIYKVDIESLTLKLAAVETAHMACPMEKSKLADKIDVQVRLVLEGKTQIAALQKEMEKERKEKEELTMKLKTQATSLTGEKSVITALQAQLKEATLDRDKALIDKAKVEAKVDGLLNEVRDAHSSTNTAEDSAAVKDHALQELRTELQTLKNRFGVLDEKEPEEEQTVEAEKFSGDVKSIHDDDDFDKPMHDDKDVHVEAADELSNADGATEDNREENNKDADTEQTQNGDDKGNCSEADAVGEATGEPTPVNS